MPPERFVKGARVENRCRYGVGETRERIKVEFHDLLHYFAALLLVLAMVGGAGLLARRFGVPGVTKAASIRRLAVVETLMLGPRQRLVILRRDNVEHLILSGPEGASVIESGIPANTASTS